MAEEPAVPTPATDRDTPSRRAGLRDEIAAALEAADYRMDMRRGDLADAVLPVLYREWPWLRAEAEDAATDRDALRESIAAALDSLQGTAHHLPPVTRRRVVEAALAAVLPAPTAQAAAYLRAADTVEAMNEGCGRARPCASCDARTDAADALRDTARRLAGEAQQDETPSYPHPDGDVTVLGPEVFASSDGDTISWKGTNYVRQPAREAQQDPTQDGEGPTWSDTCPYCKRWYTTSEPGAHEASCPKRPAAGPAAVARPGQPDTDTTGEAS